MTGWRKRQVMEMAVEAGWDAHNAEFDTRIETFAALVREGEREKWMERTAILIRGEREACAKVCEDGNFLHAEAPDARFGKACATAIRNRGQA
jgi:hypothetical protein